MTAITEIKANDEITHKGDRYVVTKAPRRMGTKGEAAHLIEIFLIPSARAGVREDGTLEFGQNLGSSHRLADTTDVELVRSGVQYRTVRDYAGTYEGGNLTAEDMREEREGSARSELVRVALRRKQREAEATEDEAMFRRGIRQALDAGISVAEIRRETGLSRERIYQIRDGRR